MKTKLGGEDAVPLHTKSIRFLMILLFGSVLVGCWANERAGKPSDETEAAAGCRGLTEEECFSNLQCEAIPYWGESLVPCVEDERGFSENCPYEGCRTRDANCPSLHDLVGNCPNDCPYNRFAIDADSGCKTCTCAE
jgi:hypothetical protein